MTLEEIKSLLMGKRFVDDPNDPSYSFKFNKIINDDAIGFYGYFTCYDRWYEGQVYKGHTCYISECENDTLFIEGDNTVFEREFKIDEINTKEKLLIRSGVTKNKKKLQEANYDKLIDNLKSLELTNNIAKELIERFDIEMNDCDKEHIFLEIPNAFRRTVNYFSTSRKHQKIISELLKE